MRGKKKNVFGGGGDVKESEDITRACHGPALVERPNILSWSGPRPGQAHQVFIRSAAARPGPSVFYLMGLGPARPTKFYEDGPRPGPDHQIVRGRARPVNFFRGRAAARPGLSNFKLYRPDPSIFKICRPGPARPMTFAARPTIHGLHMGRPVDSKSRPMGRPTGWPMCYPALKSAH